MRVDARLDNSGTFSSEVLRPNLAHAVAAGLLIVVAFGFIENARSQQIFQLVHSFGTSVGVARFPNAGLIAGIDGNLYGTASIYQTNLYGSTSSATVFRFSPDGQVTNVHIFSYPSPYADYVNRLVQSGDGNLYGTAGLHAHPQLPNPGNLEGFLFKITPNGDLHVLAGFWGT